MLFRMLGPLEVDGGGMPVGLGERGSAPPWGS